jgi:hypothetical protein
MFGATPWGRFNDPPPLAPGHAAVIEVSPFWSAPFDLAGLSGPRLLAWGHLL